MRNKKRRKGQEEFKVEQEVVRTGVQGHAFDVILRFNNPTDPPELFMDENVKMIIEGLTARYGKILVKINWFDSNLMVIAPDDLPEDATYDSDAKLNQNAPQGT